MVLQVNVHEAKTHFSKLLIKAREGQEIVIAKAGRPVARLVPIVEEHVRRTPGSAKGKIVIADDFDSPLPETVLAAFES
ncbi:MAG: type II toxin-antitoxin system Phd/YefM family antitoxin [Peptococcaceae bacterium]|jgi:prevent-host-death family protein|nr:type II toxin-antitoxin system Phd/YefM family antitoxin [Peptococcaceae bacterium]